MSETQTPIQPQSNPNPDPKELIIKLWEVNKMKILEEIANLQTNNLSAIEEKAKILAKATLDMYRGNLIDSISLDKWDIENIEKIIEQGWTINDIECNYAYTMPFSSSITVYCKTPNGKSFRFGISYIDEGDMNKQIYEKYINMVNRYLVNELKKMIARLSKELDSCMEQLRKHEEEGEEEDC